MARTEKKRFKYQKRDAATIKERQNQRSGNFDSMFKDKFKTYKVREGKNLIRILPPTWDDARHYGMEIYVNYGIGVDNQSYLSLSKMKGSKNDPIEIARRAAEREGDEKTSRALVPKKRVLMWVIDRLDEDEGPQLWPAPWTVDRDIANLCFDEDTNEAIQLDDPNEGADLRFYREGKGRNTEYNPAKMKILKPGPISDDEELQEQWLDFIAENPLPSVLQFHDEEHIANVFGGASKKDDDDDDEDEKPKGKFNRRGKKDDDDDDEDDKPVRKRKPVADDDDDDDDDKPVKRRKSADDDDEDEDDKPVRKRKPVADDDDDEDEKPAKRTRTRTRHDDDDDDEDEPVKKGKRKPAADDDDDDEPVRRRKPVDDDEDEDEDEKPAKKRKPVADDDDDDDDDDEEDEKPKSRQSVRDRLKGRTRRQADED